MLWWFVSVPQDLRFLSSELFLALLLSFSEVYMCVCDIALF